MIRSVKIDDAAAIRDIYNYYIINTIISFEEEPVSIREMTKRIRNISASYPWLVWEESEEVLGYAYIHQWHERAAYRYSAEVSIYLKKGHEGKGIGGNLFAHLLEKVKKSNIHALISGITLPNERSIALHEKFGFKKVARFNEVGFKMNKWLDVGYWELILK
jgi:phosphinothricin acetyltransferase